MDSPVSKGATQNYRLGIGGFRQIFEYALEQGLDRHTCLRDTGVNDGMMEDPQAEIVVDQELALIRNVVDVLGNGFEVGLEVGQRQHLTSLGMVGLGIMSSENGRQAGEWGARFVSAAFPLLRYRLVMENRVPLLIIMDDHLSRDLLPFLYARDLATMHNIHLDLLPDQPFGIRRVQLSLPACLSGMSRLESLFGCRVETGHEMSRLRLDPRTLEMRFPQANPLTRDQCETHCQEVIRRRREPGRLADRIRQQLRREGNLGLSFTDMAGRLNLSERNARRILKDEGTSWRQLREEVLMDIARDLLRTGDMPVQRVAEHLGYAESSSFCHAFKRYTGYSPARFCRETAR